MPNRKYEVHLPAELPPEPTFEPNIRRAPDRGLDLIFLKACADK